jgi:hypothetical protein
MTALITNLLLVSSALRQSEGEADASAGNPSRPAIPPGPVAAHTITVDDLIANGKDLTPDQVRYLRENAELFAASPSEMAVASARGVGELFKGIGLLAKIVVICAIVILVIRIPAVIAIFVVLFRDDNYGSQAVVLVCAFALVVVGLIAFTTMY